MERLHYGIRFDVEDAISGDFDLCRWKRNIGSSTYLFIDMWRAVAPQGEPRRIIRVFRKTQDEVKPWERIHSVAFDLQTVSAGF